MRAMANAIGLKGASSYQRYEDSDLYTRKYLPIEMADGVMEALTGRGSPPISLAEVQALFGIDTTDLYEGEDKELIKRSLDSAMIAENFYAMGLNRPLDRKFIIYIARYIDLRPELRSINMDRRTSILCLLTIYDVLEPSAKEIMSIAVEDRADWTPKMGEPGAATVNGTLLGICVSVLSRASLLNEERHSERGESAERA